MENDLTKYLSQYIHLTEHELQLIEEHQLVKFYEKDTILLNEGAYAKECYLVLKGCVRTYYLLDGEEFTTEFYTENQPIAPVSYVQKTPSKYYISCVEDCLLSLGSEEKTKLMMQHFPKFGELVNKISSELLANKQVSFDQFKNLPPEMRYLKLLELRPELIERAPLHQIASYLGIKPPSLSRIRKRLSQQK